MMQKLDPYTLPLEQTCLIEASAGTGKTYTLTLLYLRLLLEKQLPVDQILVVTFTRAATEELRSRIRQRIRDALDALNGEQAAEPQLMDLLAGLPESQARQLLTDALVRMDEGAIFTIHGFCQRLLQDNAFETGTPFQAEFIEQELPLRVRIMEDFWRLHLYPADRNMTTWFTSHWTSPEELLNTVSMTLATHGVQLIPDDIVAALTRLRQELHILFPKLCSMWQEHRDDVCSIVENNTDLTRSEKTYRLKDKVPELLQAMDALAEEPVMPLLIPGILHLLKQSVVAASVKKKCTSPPEHDFFLFFEEFSDLHERYEQLCYADTIVQARTYLHDELEKRKTQQGYLFFDDLLVKVHRALHHKTLGDQFALQAATRYPAILVDEFQDTDPLQYRIFSQIHQCVEHQWLCLIGDPKQAIYSFRGADIFTYVQARRATIAQNRFTMVTNYRSCGPMVRAVNSLFSRPDPFLSTDIPFTTVEPAPENQEQRLTISGNKVVPLNMLLLHPTPGAADLKKSFNKATGDQLSAEATANSIATLLAQGLAGEALINTEPVSAGDIAVLVRTHSQAQLIQQALSRLSITSVAFSQESVFLTREADQLATVLSAIIDPSDRPGVRAALATDLFGMNATAIQTVNGDAFEWNTILHRLLTYRRIWDQQGIMAMFQYLISSEDVVQRITARLDGSRLMTNFMHLAELLQTSPATAHGKSSLMRWFAEQRHRPDSTVENQQIRLEDDERLVQIVTIHKSKGLEYPIVFFPFLWREHSFSPKGPLLFHDRETFTATVDLLATDREHIRLAREEELAEQRRLLYVAVTRARYACFICAGWALGYANAPLFSLLPNLPEQALQDIDQLQLTMNPLFNQQEQLLAVKPGWKSAPALAIEQENTGNELRAADFTGRITLSTETTSYSRLTAQLDDHELRKPTGSRPAEVTEPEIIHSPFSFPKGAFAGTCLHNILEQIDFSATTTTWNEIIAAELRKAGIDEEWQELTATWLKQVVAAPLPNSCPLKKLTNEQQIAEMGFLFPVDAMSLQQFNHILNQWNLPALSIGSVEITALMKGFIDLIFTYNNRYFIADYKSNYLGCDLEDYSQPALQQAIEQHRYDLQYLIYTVALHRYLRLRLSDYSYQEHFGGVYYLFLRGMDATRQDSPGIFFTQPDAGLIQALDSCFSESPDLSHS